MKLIKWIVIGVVVLIVIVLGVVWANLNGIIRRTVETQATASLDLKTTLAAANLSIFGGSLSLKDLEIASPPGYKAPQMLSVGDAGVNVALGQLTSQPIHIKHIGIDSPKIVIEANGTKLNFQAILDQQSKTPTDPKSGETESTKKVIVDQLDVTNAQIALRPGLSIPGLKDEYAITLPAISMTNVGNADGSQNGVAIKDLVAQLLTTVASKAADSDQLPPELKNLLHLNVGAMAAQYGKQLQDQLGKNVGDLTKNLGGGFPTSLPADLGKGDLGKSVPKDLGKDLGGFLGGKKEKKS